MVCLSETLTKFWCLGKKHTYHYKSRKLNVGDLCSSVGLVQALISLQFELLNHHIS